MNLEVPLADPIKQITGERAEMAPVRTRWNGEASKGVQGIHEVFSQTERPLSGAYAATTRSALISHRWVFLSDACTPVLPGGLEFPYQFLCCCGKTGKGSPAKIDDVSTPHENQAVRRYNDLVVL